jgi:alanine racemase
MGLLYTIKGQLSRHQPGCKLDASSKIRPPIESPLYKSASLMPRPLVATIHIAAMRHNLSIATRHANGAKVWAVVKANAYGHGLARAMRGFEHADGLSLLEFDAAITLRENGWVKPILMLEGCFEFVDMLSAIRYRLQPVVHCVEQIIMLEHAIREHVIDAPIDVHIKLNSGMNRLGFAPDDFKQAYQRLRNLSQVGQITFITHFANADDAQNIRCPLGNQINCFEACTAGLEGQRTLANSAADLYHPSVAADWVRPGIMLYGASPSEQAANTLSLKPAMCLTSQLIAIQNLQTGDAVGYGSRFSAPHPMRIGVVACGYADGYPRHAPDGTPIIVNGVRTVLVGRVSMDMLMVDLRPVPDAQVGSEVSLWGRDLPIDEVAVSAGTIGYELMCALAPRVRIVEDDSETASSQH